MDGETQLKNKAHTITRSVIYFFCVHFTVYVKYKAIYTYGFTML